MSRVGIPVDDEQRAVVADCPFATNANADRLARSSGALRDLHAGNLSLKSLRDVSDSSRFEFSNIYCCDCAR
jgi:hypothetical protein